MIDERSAAPALELSGVESSYRENNYGGLFYALTRIMRPALAVELGTYQGYSALHIAAAMRDNGGARSELHLIDLWDAYPFRHCALPATKRNFQRNGLLDRALPSIAFHERDAASAAKDFEDDSIDLLHIDISNDGAKMAEIVPLWKRKLRASASTLLLIEGGSVARDRIDWMLRFRKPALRPWIESSWVRRRFSAFTFEPFPSLTLLRRIQ